MGDFLQADSEWALHRQLPPWTYTAYNVSALSVCLANNQHSGSHSSGNDSIFPLLRNVLFPSFVPLLFLNYSFITRFLDQVIFHLFVACFLFQPGSKPCHIYFFIFLRGSQNVWHIKMLHKYWFPFLLWREWERLKSAIKETFFKNCKKWIK